MGNLSAGPDAISNDFKQVVYRIRCAFVSHPLRSQIMQSHKLPLCLLWCPCLTVDNHTLLLCKRGNLVEQGGHCASFSLMATCEDRRTEGGGALLVSQI